MHDASFLGVYSLRIEQTIGNAHKKMYYVWAENSGTFLIQMLDAAHQPVGEKKSIGPATFKTKYSPEPSVLETAAGGGKKLLTGGVPDAAAQATQSEVPLRAPTFTPPSHVLPANESAEQQTERYLRSVFTTSIKRCRSVHDKKAAISSIRNIIEVEEGIVTEHKFMFADFGIALRKNNLLELSLSCCKRVLELALGDDHAHFNAARILFEMGEFIDAEQHLLKAQILNPEEGIYQKMLDYMLQEQRRRWRPQKLAAAQRKSQSRRQRLYR